MKKTYIEFKDLQIGDKFRVKGGRKEYVKSAEDRAVCSCVFYDFVKNSTVEKL